MPRNLDTTLAATIQEGLVYPARLAQLTFRSQTVNVWSGPGPLTWSTGTIPGEVANWAGPYTSLATGSSSGLPTGNAPRTMCGWIQTTNTARQAYFGYGASGAGEAFVVELGITGAGVVYFVGYADDLAGTINIADGNWHHVAVVYDGTTAYLYVDGVLDTSSAMPLGTPSGSTFTIFQQVYEDGATYWPASGSVKDVRVYNAALTGAEILSIANGTAGTSTTFQGLGSLGTVGTVGTITEGVDISADGTTVTLSGIDPTILGECLTDVQPGAPAKIWFALVTPDCQLIGTPYLQFSGCIDVPTVTPGTDTVAITLSLESQMLDLGRPTVRRYTSADQRLTYPTDSAFDSVEPLNDTSLIWGS